MRGVGALYADLVLPQTPFERIFAIALLISALVLIFLIVRETRRPDEPPAKRSAATVAATVAQVLAATSPATTRSTPPESVPRPRPAAKPAPKKPLTRLLLVASRGSSWLTVRAGSAQGKVLYTGLLPQGGEVDAKGKQLWVRFGGAGNLTAQLNGKPLRLRSGTYNALISRRGLQLVAG